MAIESGENFAAHQTDGVQAVDARAVADGLGKRQRVLRDDREAADEGVLADAAELVDAGERADRRVVLDGDVPAERRRVPEDRVVPDMAIVRDVRVRHEHVVIADLGDAAAAAVPRWIVTNSRKTLRSPTTSRVGSPLELQVLRDQADRRERKDLVAVADLGRPVDDRRGADAAVAAEPHMLADDGVRTDRPCRRRSRRPGARPRSGRW